MNTWRRRRKAAPGLRAARYGEALELRTVLSTGYLQLSLASDSAGSALVQDPNLVGPWGITVNSNGTGNLWVVGHGSGVATSYSGGAGAAPFHDDSMSVSNLGTGPSGDVINGSTNFVVHSGNASGPATLLFDSQDGKISGWNASVPPPTPSSTAETVASTSGAVYTGLALENNNNQSLIYAADFHDDRIDVFNSSFSPITLSGSFTDPNLPAGYAPYNIANIGGRLLVSYAPQDANHQNPVVGVGHGVIDEFDYNGNFQGTLIAAGGKLNDPWGMVQAPANFGDFSGELLVADAGDGRINAFDPTTGAFMGAISSPSGNPLVFNGLHGLSFGNGLSAGGSNALYYTAAGTEGQQGVLGEIVSSQTAQFPTVGNALTGTAHFAVSGVVAVFNDLAAGPASGFTASVNWGDNSSPSTGTVVALPSGGFGISSSHTYPSPGQYSVLVRIQDAAGNVTTATASASIAKPGLVFTPAAVTATEGIQFSGQLTSFIDQNGNNFAGFYQATIDWGDGTTTAGTVTGTGPFSVSGAHTYADAGSDPVTITVNEIAEDASGSTTAAATVVSSLSGTPLTITPSQAIVFNGPVARFTDANAGQSSGDYSATIDWGDGTTSVGQITTNNNGGYNVVGTHSYNDYGTDGIAVTISDPGSTITVNSTADIADGNMLSATGMPLSLREGSPYSGPVATFSDTIGATPASQFAATIDWGDGTMTTGTVTGSAGGFTIAGAHTYLDEGPFTVTTSVHDIGGTASADAQATATVADVNQLSMTPFTFTPVATETFNGAVATVTDTFAGAPAGIFHATIAWGDGVTTAGVVSGSNGAYTVSGSHAYADEGIFAAKVTIADHAPGTASATATATAEVAQSPPLITPVAVNGVARASVSAMVATFIQPGSSVGASSYTATIAWGDGTISAGTITTAGSAFDVSGSHVYASAGAFDLSVTVSRTGGKSSTATGTATLSDPLLSNGTTGTPDMRWVNHVYESLLNREADVGALTFWPAQLTAGLTRTQVVAAIEGSAEYRGDEVQTIYQTYLHRAAEAGAQTFGIQYLGNHTVEQLAALVIGSSEYFQSRGGGTNDGFLDALFSDLLHRSIDAGAKSYFDGLLNSGTTTGQLASLVFASGEYLDDLVQSFYLDLLDRPADPGGQAFFAGQLQQGATDGQIIALLAASDEYFAKTSA
ncbi:MAG TPA: TIGR03118 family protein [Pirellulales bacterium]|nr:TIGR03118 family protein [Pirellulales bacterium]